MERAKTACHGTYRYLACRMRGSQGQVDDYATNEGVHRRLPPKQRELKAEGFQRTRSR